MFLDSRILIMFGANALLLFLCSLVNSSLAAIPTYLILLGPMLIFPSLYLQQRSYFLCTLLTGLWVDAALPSNFGFFTFAFLSLGTLICLMRVRFRVEHNYHPIILAHCANATLILLLTLCAGLEALKVTSFWLQTGLTLLLSHLCLLLVAPWFFNFQRALFEIFQLDSEPEDFPIL